MNTVHPRRPGRAVGVVIGALALIAATVDTGRPVAAAPTAAVPAAATVAGVACEPGGALGLAGGFAEFIRGDAQRVSDSEGRVAYGGTATLGNPAQGTGFSIGSGQPADSVGIQLPNDPDRNDLIVGGELKYFNVVVAHGSVRYGSATSNGGFLDYANGTVSQGLPEARVGGPTFSFADQFALLEARAHAWSLLAAHGVVTAGPPPGQTGSPKALTLVGADASLNVFALSTAQLNAATEIWLRVPAGSTTLVNVAGATVDLAQGPMGTVFLWDPVTSTYIADDHFINGKPVPSTDWLTIRQSLLWNLPDTTSFLKNYVSWPGTILAPRAAFEFGRGNAIGPGHIDGSLIAASVTSSPGAETHDMVFVGCLPEPPVEKGSITIVKRTLGDHAGAATDFTFDLDCDGTTYDREVTLEVVPPATEAGTVVDGIPVGTTCVLLEASIPPGWSLASVTPHSVVVPSGGGAAAVFTAVNSRDGGYIRVTKALSGETLGVGHSFVLEVSCPAAGFNEEVEVHVPEGSPSAWVDAGPIPTGVSCTVTEPAVPNGWDLTSISPSTVTVGSAIDPPVVVTATNTRQLGELTVRKVVTGDTPPASSHFGAFLDCQGTAHDQPITLGIPSPSEVTVADLPVGMSCRVTEPHLPLGWTNVSITPAEVTITAAAGVDVTITNDFASGSVRVVKQLDAPAVAAVAFTVRLDCNGSVHDQDIVLNVALGASTANQVVTGIPTGTRCEVRETTLPPGYGFVSVAPPGGVVVGDGTTVDLTVTNQSTVTPSAILLVRKQLRDAAGAAAPALADTTFTVRLSGCTNAVPQTDVDVVVPAGDSEASSEVALPSGTQCNVSEVSVPAGWSEVSVTPSPVTVGTPPAVTEVVAVNRQQTGSLQVRKVVTGSPVTAATAFPVRLTCLAGDTHDQSVDLVVAAASSEGAQVITGLPVGLACGISETYPPTGYTQTSILPASQTVAAGPTVNEIVVTNNLTAGDVAVAKSLAAATPLAASFQVFLDCDGTAWDSLDTIAVPAGARGGSVTHTGIPAGTACIIEEAPQEGWRLEELAPPVVVVTAGAAVTLTVTNAAAGGVVDVTKVVQGTPSPVATTFPMTLTCGTAAPVAVSVVVPAGSTTSTNVVSGLPDGVTCTLAEPTMPAYWQHVGIQQSTAKTDGADGPPNPVATNTLPTGQIVIRKALQAGAAGQSVAFTFTVDCTGTAWDRTVVVGLTAAEAEATGVVAGQPTGLTCGITEAAAAGWQLVSAPTVQTAPGGAVATFVNARTPSVPAEGVPLGIAG